MTRTGQLEQRVAELIRDGDARARAEERERCALIAESYGEISVAAAIRETDNG